MTYSRKAITQLNRKYKSVLMKCALINAGLFMVISPAMGADWNYNGEGEDYGYVVDNPLTKTTNITGLLTFRGTGISSRSILNGGNSVRVFNVAEGVQNAVLAGYYSVINGFANQGGGLYNSGTISISESDSNASGGFTENKATRGGAIYNNGIMTGIKGDFTSNSATDNGGAIYNKRTITGNIEGMFRGNSAEKWEGGAIYNAYGATINGINATFNDNTANLKGGAIHNEATIGNVNNGTEVAISGSFGGNSSGERGGAISNVGVITNIDSDFSRNTSLKGGAINNYKGTGGYDGWGGEYNQPGEIGTIKGSFTSNKATNGNGGAINNEGKITTVDASFDLNTASNNGGAIFNEADASSYDRGIEEIKGSFTSNSATNNGGAIYNNGDITTVNAIFTSNRATNGNGGAIYNNSGATIGTIKIASVNSYDDEGMAVVTSIGGNSANNGGAVYNKGTISNINKANMDSEFNGNSAVVDGGAIYNEGTISNVNATFRNNTAGEKGGAIYNKGTIANFDDASVNGSASSNYFNSNSAKQGGAIFNVGTIQKLMASFLSNRANEGNGGAIYNKNGGIIDNIIGGYIKHSVAGEVLDNEVINGEGGAIFNEGSIGVIGGDSSYEIASNNSGNYGGAISNYGTITTVNAKFDENTSKNGGAIYNKKDSAYVVDDETISMPGKIETINGSFTSNEATNGHGGAIYNSGDITKINATFTSNNATVNGGAIFNDGTIGDVSDENANAISGSFNENVATNNGGAIRNNGRITKIIASFSKNKANNGFGGAIYNANNMTINSIDGATFSENEAKQGGGALLNEGNITSVNATFSQNKVLNGLGGAILNFKNTIGSIAGSFIGNMAYRGGAIYNKDVITKLTGNYTNNSATSDGGAIYNDTGASINSLSGTYSGNSTSDGWGGAFMNYGSVASSNASFEANTTNKRGGAIYNKASGLITNLGGSFTSNSAGETGGALFNEKDGNTSGQITTLSANFTSNSATNNGGAVYNNGDIGAVLGSYWQNSASNGGGIYNSGNISSIAIGADFTSNTASNNGGAIFNDGTIELINYDFDDNSAVSGNGGAIYNAGNIKEFANRLVNEVAFTGNQANNGGAIYNSGTIGDVNANAISGSFNENVATNNGGAIYNNGRITNVDADFISNSANQGGAIYNTENGTIDVIDGEFDSNIGNQSGGAIANVGNIGTIKADFRENGANTWNGGGIFNFGSIDNIASASFRGNTAIQNGGAIAVSSGSIGNIHSITDTNAEFSENHAGKFGGAIINEATINKIVANFKGNYVSSDDYDEDKKYDVASGGAIYNQGTITNGIVNSSFQNNYAKNESGNAFGGAIYTTTDLSVVADNGVSEFIGNYVLDSNGKRDEAIFVGNANATLTLEAKNGGAIKLADSINGTSGYDVDITGDSSGTIELNNDIKNADVSVEKVKIDMSNGNIDTRTFMTLNAENTTDNAKWEIDVKFEDSTSDKIVVTNASSGKILVDKLNLVGDVEAKVGETLNFHVLNTQDENIQLALGNEVVTNPIVRDDILYSEEVKENTLWTDTYNRVVGHYEVNGIVGLTKTNTTNDTISFEVERVDYTQKTVLGDTLAMVNNAENLTDKAFNFESKNDKYVATDNLGETKGNVSVNGVANGDAKSEISLGNYSGFEVGDNTNLSINNTKVVGNGSVLDVREGGSVNLDNAVLDGLVTNKGEIVAEKTVFDGDVVNDGVIDAQDIVLNGDVTNNNNIVAEDMEFGGDVVNDGVIDAQKIVLSGDVTNNNNIVAEDMEFGGDVRNDGVIEATNGSIELNGDVSGDGLINVNNSDLIINAKFDDNDITLNGGNISLGDNANINGGNLVVEAGNIDILAKKVNVDSAKFGANSTLALKVDSLSEYGVLNAKDSLEIEEGATLKATLAQGLVGIGKTEEVKLLTSDNDFENNFTDVMENNMYSFVKKEGDTGVYEIRQTKTAQDVIEENGGSSVNQGSASAWVDGDSFENDSVAKDVADKLADMAQNNAKEFDKALTTLAPDLAPIVKSNVIHHGGQVFGAVSNRLSNGGIANGKGMASGDSKVDGGAVWVQTMGNVSTLDGGENSSGFESKTAGVTLGVEKQIDDVKVGVGYAYSQSDIDADNNLREIEVDTHTALMYGEYKPNNWFINTQIAYAFADYDETKRALGSNYMAQYDVETLGVQALTGYDFRICRDKLTPIAGLRYYHIKRDGYMDSAMQYVSSDTMDILTAVLGVKFEGNVRTELGSRFVVRTHANLTYDLITDRDNAYVGLQNGSSYLVKGDSLERLGVEVGGSIGFNLNEAIDISIGYEGRFREDFQDHTGILSAKYKL